MDLLRAEMQAEFRDALLHAYHGPRVDMSDRRLPDCFEADERTDANSTDVLQLLSGRLVQGLGFWRCAGSHGLASQPAAQSDRAWFTASKVVADEVTLQCCRITLQ